MSIQYSLSERIQLITSDQQLATLYAVNPAEPFDNGLSDLLLRNAAVASYHLAKTPIRDLDPQTTDILWQAGEAAAELKPLSDGDRIFLYGETEAEWDYRTGIVVPLHGAQSLMNSNKAYYSRNDEKFVAASRQVIKLGSLAFTTVLRDPGALASKSITETMHYFTGNSFAAVEKAIRLKQLQDPNHPENI